MAEYIERDALRGDILSNECGYPCETVNYFLGLLDCQPAADVAPVKRGEWARESAPVKRGVWTRESALTNFGCTSCGVDMTGENA